MLRAPGIGCGRPHMISLQYALPNHSPVDESQIIELSFSRNPVLQVMLQVDGSSPPPPAHIFSESGIGCGTPHGLTLISGTHDVSRQVSDASVPPHVS